MKSKLLVFAHYWNIIYVIAFLLAAIISPLIGYFKEYVILINTFPVLYFRFILMIPIFYLWILYIRIWTKYDNRGLRLLALIFLNAFYFPFYYKVVRNNNWYVFSNN